MGFTIEFWKLERPIATDNVLLSLQLQGEEKIDGVAILPVAEILEELQESIQCFDSLPKSISAQFFSFELESDADHDELEDIVEIMAEYGCPLFDPQRAYTIRCKRWHGCWSIPR